MATPTAPAPAPVELSDGERRFVEEYMIDLCYSASYRRAFPMTSYNTAKTLGPAMARREHVRAAIRAEMRDRSIRTQVSADSVLRELVRIAQSDIFYLIDPRTDRFRDPRRIPFDV